MTIGDAARESVALVAIRRFLLGTLAFGTVGTIGELILLGHVEMPAQWIPFFVLGGTVVVIAWHASTPSALSVRAMQVFMVLGISTGAVGVGLHLDGNIEFERELHPEERGFEFLRKTVAGATPVLAPGSMVLLGLIGLGHTHRHPCTADAGDRIGEEKET